MLEVLHSGPFADKAPAEVHATLLDQGVYHCSNPHDVPHPGRSREVLRATLYQLRHPKYHKPQLVAKRTQPGVVVGHHQARRTGEVELLHLYVILDIYSRYVVGWMIAHRESEDLAERLIRETIAKPKA